MKLRLYESTVDDKARMTIITYIIGLTFLSTALVLVYKFYDYQKRFKDLEKKLEKTLQNRKDERIGRTRAEKRYRELLLERNPAGVEQLKPVAVARTVFHDRRGAPRQGGVTPQARGILEMLPWTQPHLTLTGLQDFSHLWVIFVFHHNTNLGKKKKQQKQKKKKNKNNGDGRDDDKKGTKKKSSKNALAEGSSTLTSYRDLLQSFQSSRSHFHALIKPPRLEGKRVGVFSTRTPHRPNPIGLTLVKIEKLDLDNQLIHVSGVDLVDGTPILDIKPYVPMYDCKPEAVVSDWIAHTRKEYGSRRVLFVEETRRVIEQAIAIDSTSGAVSSRKSVEEREGKDGDREPVDSGVQRNTKLPAQLSFYDDVHELRDAIAQVLANDIRSLQSKRRDVKSRGSHITDVMRSEENESNRTTNSNNNNNTEKSRNSQGSNHRGGCEGKGRNTKTQDKDIGDATTGGRWPDWTSLSPSSDSDAAGTPSSDCSDDDRANRDDDEADALLASPQVDVEDLQLYEVRYNQLVLKYVIEPVEEGSSSSRVLVLQASLLAE